MHNVFPAGLAVAVAMVTGLAACGSARSGPGPAAAVQPGAPGEPSRVVTPADRASAEAVHTAADVGFMQHMILHHAQALEMAALVPERSEREDIRLLARRIALSQDDEIRLMRRWLERRGEAVHAPRPEPGAAAVAHAGAHPHEPPPSGQDPELEAPRMAGMLSAEQLAGLAAARGPEFDRLFLELMIHHHQGALHMVAELFESPGAAQGSEIFQFASHVDGDQRIEIARMRRMLAAIR